VIPGDTVLVRSTHEPVVIVAFIPIVGDIARTFGPLLVLVYGSGQLQLFRPEALLACGVVS